MSYSSLYTHKNSKTLHILVVISFVSLFMGGFFLINQLGKQNGWQRTEGISRVYIVNRSSHGFEIIWTTKRPETNTQWVEVGTNKGTYPIISKVENNNGIYNTVISGLNADTTYYFRVRVGIKTYILPPLISEMIHTPKEVKEKPVSPAYGKVVLPSTKPYANGLLIYEIDGYYPLATFTKETGEWLLPLTGLIEKKTNTINSVSGHNLVSIKLFSYPEGIIQARVDETRPFKRAITAGTSLQLAQTTHKAGESVLGTFSYNAIPEEKIFSRITYPKENAIIPGTTPLIRGTAPSGMEIVVLIQAGTKQYSYRTKSDEKGEWIIQYPLVLEPGRYTITATISNNIGVRTIVRRVFTIIKSGEKVLGVATGTPTLIPTRPIIPTTVIPPTQIPTTNLYPTTIPVPTRLVPTATPPVTGGGMSMFLFGALFCIIVGAGLVLAF